MNKEIKRYIDMISAIKRVKLKPPFHLTTFTECPRCKDKYFSIDFIIDKQGKIHFKGACINCELMAGEEYFFPHSNYVRPISPEMININEDVDFKKFKRIKKRIHNFDVKHLLKCATCGKFLGRNDNKVILSLNDKIIATCLNKKCYMTQLTLDNL